ncbi:MAG: 2-C-methyl-D-erythritol 2,4-cyclodiphosphate synthase, partial [Burkholderiaceae bacterium]
HKAGYTISNIDSTVIAQAPRLRPWIDSMRASVAKALSISIEQVSIKAKSAEHLGPVGEGRAIEARAIALLLG